MVRLLRLAQAERSGRPPGRGDDAAVADVLTTDRIQEFKAARLASGAAKETVNNDLGAVSVLATFALGQSWIDERPRIKRFGSKDRIRYLEPDELAAYMAALRRLFRPIMQLLVGTGMRIGEGEALRMCDHRFGSTENRVSVRSSKTQSGVRSVFVPPWGAAAVKAHVDGTGSSGTEPVFTTPRRVVQAEHKRACGLVGLHDSWIHDPRHTAAVALPRAGLPLHLLQQQLGHKHITMTMKYARFHSDYSDVASIGPDGCPFWAGRRERRLAGNRTGNTRCDRARGGCGRRCVSGFTTQRRGWDSPAVACGDPQWSRGPADRPHRGPPHRPLGFFCVWLRVVRSGCGAGGLRRWSRLGLCVWLRLVASVLGWRWRNVGKGQDGAELGHE